MTMEEESEGNMTGLLWPQASYADFRIVRTISSGNVEAPKSIGCFEEHRFYPANHIAEMFTR